MDILTIILFIQILIPAIVARSKGVKLSLVLYLSLASIVIALSTFTSAIGSPMEVAKAEAVGLAIFLLLVADLLGLKYLK